MSYSVAVIICMILRLAVLKQYLSATDTQTHRQTDKHTTKAYTAYSMQRRGVKITTFYTLRVFGQIYGYLPRRKRTSGIALAMRHRLEWFIYLRAQGLSKGNEHHANTPHGVR